MGVWERIRQAISPMWDGTTGRPPSGNGASSLHLFWDVPPGAWTAAEVTLEVVEPPTVPKLYFWALQVSFSDRGRSGGGGHLGLQWHREHPGMTAVNWGGYGADGRELTGSTSVLPSATGNVNTRDYPWVPGRPYLLRVAPSPEPGAWRGSITDLEAGVTTHVRDLHAPGTTIDGPMVWSEVFADCDEPATAVRWSGLTLEAADGRRATVGGVRVNYQALAEGGCVTTDASVESGDRPGFVQRTGTTRVTRQGESLRL